MSGTIAKIVILMGVLLAAGCGAEVEVGYQPPLVPIRISIDTSGDIEVELSGSYATPIGIFDVSGGITVASLREEYANRVLIVRVDDEAVVYELAEGKRFSVSFDDSNTLYKRVAFIQEITGDVILELESTSGSAPAPQVEPPTTGGDAQVPDPEDFLRGYFHDIVNTRNYDYLWTLSSDRFKQANSDSSFRDFVEFWDTVNDVSIHSVDCMQQGVYLAVCDVEMTWLIRGNDTYLAVDYDLKFEEQRSSWIFE